MLKPLPIRLPILAILFVSVATADQIQTNRKPSLKDIQILKGQLGGLISSGECELALERIDSALVHAPKDMVLVGRRTQVLFAQGRFEEGLENNEIRLQREPTNQVLLKNKIRALKELRRFSEALEVDDTLFDLQQAAGPSNDPRQKTSRAEILLGLKRDAEALRAARNALQIDPSFRQALLAEFNALINLQRFPEALTTARRFPSGRPFSRRLVATALIKLRRYEEALTTIQPLLVNPSDIGSINLAAEALVGLEQFARALQIIEPLDLERITEPDKKNLQISKARALHGLDRMNEMLEVATQLTKEYPNDSASLKLRTRAHLDLGEYREARQFTSILTRISFSDIGTLMLEGEALLGMERRAEAIEVMDQVLEWDPNNTEAQDLKKRAQACLKIDPESERW